MCALKSLMSQVLSNTSVIVFFRRQNVGRLYQLPPPPSASYANAYASNNPRNTCGILLGSSQFPVPFSFLKWRIVTILTNKLPFLVEVVIFC